MTAQHIRELKENATYGETTPAEVLKLIEERAILMGFVAQHMNMETPGAKEVWEEVTV